MNVSVENLAPCKKLVRVEVEVQQVDQTFDSITKDFQKQASLPGFRPGKAPRDMVLRKYEKDITDEVKRKLTSRDEVVSYLTKHVNDEDTQRLRRSELVLKKFGLLPRDFNLETFLVALLREQVAGYYDPKTKTVNLLDWVPMEEQEPVMAH